jgi:hypothetical protein
MLIGLVAGWAGSAQGQNALVVEGTAEFSGDGSSVVSVEAGSGDAVWATSDSGDGVYGYSSEGLGVHGMSYEGRGVYGFSTYEAGVDGYSTYGAGVYGYGSAGPGVHAESLDKDGLAAFAYSDDKSGVFAVNDNLMGYAGYFRGRVHVTDQLSKGGGGFKIDHPLDPEYRYLHHSSVESPDMMDIYNGNAVLDHHGEAWVELPEWFEALNREFRYQLTPIGGFAPVYISQEILGNRFGIAGGTPGLKVSWQVTGVRQDAWAEAHRIPVEEDKAEIERGTYLHPVEWQQASDRDVEWVHHPELMRKRRERNGQLGVEVDAESTPAWPVRGGQ